MLQEHKGVESSLDWLLEVTAGPFTQIEVRWSGQEDCLLGATYWPFPAVKQCELASHNQSHSRFSV